MRQAPQIRRYVGAIVPAQPEHADQLWPKLRQEDAREAWAMAGLEPREALIYCLSHSLEADALLIDNRVIALVGVGPASPDDFDGVVGARPLAGGSIWAMSHEDASQPMPKRVIEDQAPRLLDHYLRNYKQLVNYVDARHKSALRWVERLGFLVWPAAPRGKFGLPFHRITLVGVEGEA